MITGFAPAVRQHSGENLFTRSTLRRNAVNVVGSGNRTMIFVHGDGRGQTMWRLVTPAFASEYKIVLYDLTGSGRSDLSSYDHRKYNTLQGHATDLLEICDTSVLLRSAPFHDEVRNCDFHKDHDDHNDDHYFDEGESSPRSITFQIDSPAIQCRK